MAEAVLNAMAQQLVDLTLCKTRYDAWDLQWYTESPFWRRTNMRYSREYKMIPDYEIGDAKHGKTLENILDEAGYLIENLEEYKKNASDKEIQRVKYLLDHVKNLHIRTRLLLGEKPSFDQMTNGLYCLVAPPYNYTNFDDILGEINQALPGFGSVQEKIKRFRKSLSIPPEKLLEVITNSTQVFHDIAVRNMTISGNSMPRVRVRELPDKNMVFLSILFGYDYNHIEYERNFNLLYPWTVVSVVEYVGHEMEPGHLTYFEKRLQTMIDTCWPEMSIVSQYSSSNAFSEGSARHAISISFDNSMDKQVEFEREIIFKNAGIDLGLVELMPLWHKYCKIAGYGKLEASRHLWNNTWTKEKARQFLEQYAFVDKGTGEDAIENLPKDEGHFVAHDYARDVVQEYFDFVSKDVKKQWKLYEQLCCSHMSIREIKDKTFRIN